MRCNVIECRSSNNRLDFTPLDFTRDSTATHTRFAIWSSSAASDARLRIFSLFDQRERSDSEKSGACGDRLTRCEYGAKLRSALCQIPECWKKKGPSIPSFRYDSQVMCAKASGLTPPLRIGSRLLAVHTSIITSSKAPRLQGSKLQTNKCSSTAAAHSAAPHDDSDGPA